jgi:pSer/pThr/pTyr-binding forkhead associated (FHA) protein
MSKLWSVVVAEAEQAALPAIHLEAPFVIGSSLDARVRLPSSVAESNHVRVEADGQWRALAPISGDAPEGAVGEGATLTIGTYRVTITPAAADATPTPPQRTESLARELLRNLLGNSAAPTLEVERGPLAGAKRPLAAPESTLVIGRGDEANWIIDDDDLSRAHAEIRRTWDGIFVTDLDSKNGTKVAGVHIEEPTLLRDGMRFELGKVAFIFRDPTEKHLPPAAARSPAPSRRASRDTGRLTTPRSDPSRARPTHGEPRRRPSTAPFYIAVAIMLLALAGFVWVVTS